MRTRLAKCAESQETHRRIPRQTKFARSVLKVFVVGNLASQKCSEKIDKAISCALLVRNLERGPFSS